MISNINKSYLLLLAVISMSFVMLILPDNDEAEASSNSILLYDKTLIITLNEYDTDIADKIIEDGPGTAINYTHIDIDILDNITDTLTSVNIDDFQNFIFILSELETGFTDEIIDVLDSRVTKGVSLTLISSKLHSLNPNLIELFGLSIPSAGIFEYNSHEEDVEYTILNDTFIQYPYQYENLETYDINANISVIDSFDENTTMILQSEFINETSSRSGFFIKIRSKDEGILLSIPLSFNEEIEEDVLEIITSLNYHAIEWSSVKTKLFIEDNNTSTSTTENNSNTNTNHNIDFSLNNEILAGAAISTGIIVVGAVTYKSLSNNTSSTKISSKKEDEIVPSPFPSWILLILGPIIWLFAQILYPPKLRRISRSQVIDNEMRAEILDILEFYEFDHFNSLKKQLNSGVSILRWHLQILEDFELIEVKRVKQFKVYHLENERIDPDRIFLYCSIRSKKAFKIIEFLLRHNSQTTKDLSLKLHISNDLIKYHSVKLTNDKILQYDALTNSYKINDLKRNNLQWLLERVKKQEADLSYKS